MADEVVLAFDYGERRIGVAVGQTALGTASPVGTLPAHGQPDWTAVDRCLRDWAPDRVLVGLPYNMNGTETVLTAACRAFAAELEPIVTSGRTRRRAPDLLRRNVRAARSATLGCPRAGCGAGTSMPTRRG
jgi:hypothetical protein